MKLNLLTQFSWLLNNYVNDKGVPFRYRACEQQVEAVEHVPRGLHGVQGFVTSQSFLL